MNKVAEREVVASNAGEHGRGKEMMQRGQAGSRGAGVVQAVSFEGENVSVLAGRCTPVVRVGAWRCRVKCPRTTARFPPRYQTAIADAAVVRTRSLLGGTGWQVWQRRGASNAGYGSSGKPARAV